MRPAPAERRSRKANTTKPADSGLTWPVSIKRQRIRLRGGCDRDRTCDPYHVNEAHPAEITVFIGIEGTKNGGGGSQVPPMFSFSGSMNLRALPGISARCRPKRHISPEIVATHHAVAPAPAAAPKATSQSDFQAKSAPDALAKIGHVARAARAEAPKNNRVRQTLNYQVTPLLDRFSIKVIRAAAIGCAPTASNRDFTIHVAALLLCIVEVRECASAVKIVVFVMQNTQ
jgi:hypothetical protein